MRSVAVAVFGAVLGGVILWANAGRFADALAGRPCGSVFALLFAAALVLFLFGGASASILGIVRRRALLLTREGIQLGNPPMVPWAAVRGFSVVHTRGGGDYVSLVLDPAAGHGKTLQIPGRLKSILTVEQQRMLAACQKIALTT